ERHVEYGLFLSKFPKSNSFIQIIAPDFSFGSEDMSAAVVLICKTINRKLSCNALFEDKLISLAVHYIIVAGKYTFPVIVCFQSFQNVFVSRSVGHSIGSPGEEGFRMVFSSYVLKLGIIEAGLIQRTDTAAVCGTVRSVFRSIESKLSVGRDASEF